MSKKGQSKKKGGSSSSSSSGSGSRGTIEIDPDIIYFTHARVRPFFTGCNKRIEETYQEILAGQTKISDLPLITVIHNDGSYFSLNNRRLFLFKWLKREGLIPGGIITATLKPALEREKSKYLPSRCTLQAKMMKEFTGKKDGDNKEGEDDEVDEEEEIIEREGDIQKLSSDLADSKLES
jgi:hypothetical protein